jgi:hypothetical protein
VTTGHAAQKELRTMRGTRLFILALGLGTVSLSAAYGQSKPQFKLLDATQYDLTIGYNNVRANAPPAGCHCFNMNGGFVFGSVHLTEWLGIVGEFTGGHSSNISILGLYCRTPGVTQVPPIYSLWRGACWRGTRKRLVLSYEDFQQLECFELCGFYWRWTGFQDHPALLPARP